MVDAAAIILAGGKSTRMGRNKALLRVTKESMIERAIKLLSGKFPEIMISANDETYASFNLKVVPDIFPGRGPLAGIHAGLHSSSREINFFLACDMPFADINLAVYMVEKCQGYDAVVPRIGGYYQPLFAVYTKRCLPAIEEVLSKGINKITAFFPAVNIKFLDAAEIKRFGDPDRMFLNVNTPEDLDYAKAMAGRYE